MTPILKHFSELHFKNNNFNKPISKQIIDTKLFVIYHSDFLCFSYWNNIKQLLLTNKDYYEKLLLLHLLFESHHPN